jgi:flagellar hook protein FlgE
MLASLTTGVSGLRSHQLLLEVVGNNLANVNTPAFKSSRALFSETLSETLRNATGATTTSGGTNPVQRGLGVQTSSIDVDTRQGTLEMTGRNLDLAIRGDGFFVVNNGTQDIYSRVGTFSIGSDGKLVHLTTGYRVMDMHGREITIPSNSRLPANPTSEIFMTGNLDAGADPPATEVLASRTAFKSNNLAATATTTFNPVAEVATSGGPFEVAGSAATAASALNGLDTNTVDYVDGDTIVVSGTDASGTAVSATFTYGAANDGTTLGDLRDAISAAFSGAMCTLDASGNLVLTADAAGEASLTLSLADGVANTGQTTWSSHAFSVTADGQEGLDDLATPYADGDTLSLSGTAADGTTVSGTFTYGASNDGTTLGDLRDFINTLFTDAACSIDASGNLVLTADEGGPSSLTLAVDDASGQLPWDDHALAETTTGAGGSTWNTSLTIFDSQGNTHILNLAFEKMAANTWDLTASLPGGDGTPVDAKVEGITFNSDGSFSQVTGTGQGDGDITLQFPGVGTADIVMNFGTSGAFDGVTQFGGSFTAAPTRQDGYEAGTLSTVSVRQDGVVQGTFTNGLVSDIATLGIATFANPSGLLNTGDGFWASTPNSGLPSPGRAGTSGSGTIRSGALESSNVDVAYEFTRLIVAQRGFQVNARTIGVSDEVLDELAHLAR